MLLDGAHNPAGAAVLRAALVDVESPITLVLGILADKDCRTICDILAPLAKRILLVPVASERSAQPLELENFCRSANPQAIVTLSAGLRAALAQTADDHFVVIAGSLYLLGEAMELLGLSPVPTADEKSLNEWTPKKS